jgi:hypothetical protein
VVSDRHALRGTWVSMYLTDYQRAAASGAGGPGPRPTLCAPETWGTFKNRSVRPGPASCPSVWPVTCRALPGRSPAERAAERQGPQHCPHGMGAAPGHRASGVPARHTPPRWQRTPARRRNRGAVQAFVCHLWRWLGQAGKALAVWRRAQVFFPGEAREWQHGERACPWASLSARMAELAYALDLGSSPERDGGSSPPSRTS